MSTTEEISQQINEVIETASSVSADSGVIVPGTDLKSDTLLTQPRSLDVHAARKFLGAVRAKHGHDTAIGRRCSNLIELLKNYETAPPDLRRDLEKFIAKSVEDLAERTK